MMRDEGGCQAAPGRGDGSGRPAADGAGGAPGAGGQGPGRGGEGADQHAAAREPWGPGSTTRSPLETRPPGHRSRDLDAAHPPTPVEGTRQLPVLPLAAAAELDAEERRILEAILAALRERGYDPARQLAHFLVTGEPAYITAHRGARVLAQRLDRIRVVEALVRAYLGPAAAVD